MRYLIILSLFLLPQCSSINLGFLSVGSTSVAIAQKNTVSVGYNMIDFGVQKKTGHSISQNILQDLQGDNDE